MLKKTIQHFNQSKENLCHELFDVEKERTYLREGYSSLFEYLTLAHHFSESQAYELVTIVRGMNVARELPRLISNGQIQFKTLKSVMPVIQQAQTLEDKREVLKLSIGKLPEQMTETLQEKFPELNLHNPIKRMTLVFDEELNSLYEQIKNKLSHKYPSGVRLDNAVNESFKFYLGSKSGSSIVSRHLHQQVWTRAKAQCEFESVEGRRCLSKYLLQIDHVIPRSRGGLDELSNLRLLCANHNRDASRLLKIRGDML